MAIEDLLHPKKDLYRRSPAWVKRTVGQLYAMLPRRIRHGKVLGEARRFLDKSQWWSRREHIEYQWGRMQRLLQHAWDNVPYYRRVMTEAGLTPEDIRSQDDWAKLPLLSKDTIRSHKEELVAENMRDRLLPANTGGSTGQPLELYWERGRTRALERAFMWRQWQWGGFRFGQRTAIVRGQTVGGLWHYDPIDRHLFVNAYEMSDANIPLILRKLRSYRPVSLQAYPSTLTTLAMWMAAHHEPPIPGLKVCLCGSENLYPEQKELFRQVFQCRIYSWYGHAESCCMAGYSEDEDFYQVYTEYGYVELVDPAGNVVPWREGNRGEIVATSLINDAMPLIRYQTGDIGIAGPERNASGRSYPLLARIEGRKQEYVVAGDGRAIPLTGLIFGQHWHAFAHMKQVQLAQSKVGLVTVRIVPGPEFTPADEQEIRDKIASCVGGTLEVAFEYVEVIPPTARGKHLFLDQSLPLQSIWSGDARA